MKNSFTLSLIFSSLIAISIPAFADSFPDEISKVADSYNCKKVEKLYDKPVEVKSDYVYEIDEKNQRTSFIFWCQSNENSHEYLLIKKLKEQRNKDNCPDLIYKDTGFPQGLMLKHEKSIRLKDYFYVDNKKAGPDISIKNVTVIIDGDDSLSTHFFCYKGRYLFNSYD